VSACLSLHRCRCRRPSASSASAALLYDEVFAFDRAVSRLVEMQSEEYLTTPWLGEATPDDVAAFVLPARQ
jgi:hypothetical protein